MLDALRWMLARMVALCRLRSQTATVPGDLSSGHVTWLMIFDANHDHTFKFLANKRVSRNPKYSTMRLRIWIFNPCSWQDTRKEMLCMGSRFAACRQFRLVVILLPRESWLSGRGHL